MESKIKIFESGIAEGVMSKNKKFYPEETTEEQINELFLQVRINLGKKYGFDGRKIFQALQKTDQNNIEYPDGMYHVINENDIDNDDLWEVKIPADILIISEKHKNIVVGNQMADCPILIVEDRKQGVTALSHCGAPYIDRLLPYQTVEALIKECKSNPNDLYVYIGSCAKKESFIYDRYPLWAKNQEVWDKYIIQNGEDYHIDMIGAMIKQIKKFNISNIEVSSEDTITNEKHYSHSAAYKGNNNKKGQNFVGFFYK